RLLRHHVLGGPSGQLGVHGRAVRQCAVAGLLPRAWLWRRAPGAGAARLPAAGRPGRPGAGLGAEPGCRPALAAGYRRGAVLRRLPVLGAVSGAQQMGAGPWMAARRIGAARLLEPDRKSVV